MARKLTLSGAAAAALVLASCGGTTTVTEPAPRVFPAPSGSQYNEFDEATGGPSDLASVAVRTADTAGTVDLTQGTGALTRFTRGLTLDDGTFAFEDDAPNPISDTYIDGTAVLFFERDFLDTTDYEYITAYTQTYSEGGDVFGSDGILGIATIATDMPNGGSARYRGEASATIINSTGTTNLTDGRSTVSVDFDRSAVSVTMDRFGTTSRPTDITSITASGMGITGNTFGGGTQVVVFDGNTALPSVIGTGITAEGAGAFYGFDTRSGIPDEVAGAVRAEGSDGSLTAIFIGE